MPSLSTNASISLSLLAGQVVQVSAGSQGVATVSGFSGGNAAQGLGPGESVIGPFNETRTVSLTCLSGTMQYLQKSTVDGDDLVIVSAEDVAAPTPDMLADTRSVYQLNEAPFTRYQSDGSELVALGGGSSGTDSGYTFGGYTLNEASIAYHTKMRVFSGDAGPVTMAADLATDGRVLVLVRATTLVGDVPTEEPHFTVAFASGVTVIQPPGTTLSSAESADGSVSWMCQSDGVVRVLSVRAERSEEGRKLLIIGDSRAEQGYSIFAGPTSGSGAVNVASTFNNGFVYWADALSGGSFPQIINAGRSGRRAQQLANNDTSVSPRDTLQNSVVGPVAEDALIWLGTNDYGSGRTATQVVGDIRTIAAAARGSGKRVTVMVETPPTSGWSAAIQKEMLRGNELLYRYASAGEFLLIDPSPDFIDYATTANVISKASTRYDTVHLNNLGAYLMGKRVAAHYAALYRGLPAGRYRHGLDDYANDSTHPNQVTNGLFLAGSTTGWTFPAVAGIITAATATVVASPNGVGNAIALDLTYNGAGTISWYRTYNNSPAWAANDTMFADADFWVQGNGGSGSPTAVAGVAIRLDIANGGSGADRVGGLQFYATNKQALPEGFAATVRTLPYVWNGAETSRSNLFFGQLDVTGAGSCRVLMSGARVMKNAAMYSSLASGGAWV